MFSRLLMIASVLIACFAWQALAQDTACIYNAHQAAVVRIEYQYDAGAAGVGVEKGSGFIVSPAGHVITADHVVRPRIQGVELKSAVILVRSGEESRSEPVKAKILEHDEADDLALLQLPVRPDGSSWPFVTVSEITTLAVGTPLMGLGFGSSGDLAIIPWGEKTANNVIVDGRLRPWWRSSLALNSGDSGGPIFDKSGNVVGVAVEKATSAVLVTYVVPIFRAKYLLDFAKVQSAKVGKCATPDTTQPVVGPKRETITIAASSFLRGTDVALGGPNNVYGDGVLLNASPYIERPNAAEFEFNADGGTYMLAVEYAPKDKRAVDILINGQLAIHHALAATTNGWKEGDQRLLNQGQVTLRSGLNVLRIESPTVFPHIRKIVLTPTDGL